MPSQKASDPLGIDAKTLRHWLQQAHLSLHPHPTDARIKCVTSQQLAHLATLHHRPFEKPAEACPSLLPETLSPQ